MLKEVLVDEPVNMLIRLMPNGEVRPTSFVWRDRTCYVDTFGRQWEERVGGRTVRCYLIQSADNQTYELHWDPDGDRWSLHRAWLRSLTV
jgi:hypothetical protein